MNNITLVAATHKKLEEAADETSTRVAICMINKWRAKINEKEIYNVRHPPRKEEGKLDLGKTTAVCTILESFCYQALKKQ